MILVPALIAILLLGVLPLGSWVAVIISNILGIPTVVSLVGLYVFILVFGTLGMHIARIIMGGSEKDDQQNLPRDSRSIDHWMYIGSSRGQGYFIPLLAITIIIGVVAVIFLGTKDITHLDMPTSAARIICILVVAAIGIAPNWALRKLHWPLSLKQFDPILDRDDHSHQDADRDDGSPKSADDKLISRTYTWSFRSSLKENKQCESFQIDLQIRQRLFDCYRNMKHPLPGSDNSAPKVLSQYVVNGMTEEVERCALDIAKLARRLDLPYFDFIGFMLAFVQDSITYTSDESLNGQDEYWAYPLETLAHKRGDCEDQAILTAAILSAVGVDVILVLLPGHVAVGIALQIDQPGDWLLYNERKYYYAETTGRWRIGEFPKELGKKLIPVPIIFPER